MLYEYMVTAGWEQGQRGWERTSTGSLERLDEDSALIWLDTFAHQMICKGYVVETMVVNPQIRSILRIFARQFLFEVRSVDRQTDRQTKLSSHL